MTKLKRNEPQPLPNAGDAFLMPLADGRFGFCHVIDVPPTVFGLRNRKTVMVEVSSWVGESAPDLDDPRLRKILVQTHHGWGPNRWRVMVDGAPPESFRKLGTIRPKTGRVLAVFTHWQRLADEVLTQWRWDHDRETLLREEQLGAERRQPGQAQLAQHRQHERDRLTLDRLQRKRRFSLWKGDRPDKAIAACRRAFREAIAELTALGSKPGKRDVSKVIRRCVEQLNALDEQYEGFIETGEREELCREIDDIVYATGLRGCDGMADRWREW